MKKAFIIIGLLIVALGLMTACGSKNSTNNSTGNNSSTNPAGSGVLADNMYHPCGGELKIGQYKGLTFTAEKIVITEDDIDHQVKKLMETYPNYTKDTTRDNTLVKDGDVVNIDYVGKVGGNAFEGGTAKDAFLKIGSKQFIDGFESSLIGKTIGTTVDINVTFPENYTPNPDLAGVAAVFTVTLNYVGLPSDEIDDAYVARTVPSLATTVEGLRKYISDTLMEDAKDAQEDEMWDALMKQAIENTEFVKILPEDVDYYYELSMATIKQYATYYKMSEEELYNTYYGTDEMTYAQFLARCREKAEQSVKEYMVLQEIIKLENITVSDEDYNKEALEYAKNVNLSTVAELEAKFGKDYVMYCVKTDKALDFIKDNAVITEAE